MYEQLFKKLKLPENNYQLPLLGNRNAEDDVNIVLSEKLQRISQTSVSFVNLDLTGLSEQGCKQFKQWFENDIISSIRKRCEENTLLQPDSFKVVGIPKVDKKQKTFSPSRVESVLYLDGPGNKVGRDTEKVVSVPAFYRLSRKMNGLTEPIVLVFGMVLLSCGEVVPSVVFYNEPAFGIVQEILEDFRDKLSNRFEQENICGSSTIGFITPNPMGNLERKLKHPVIDKNISLDQFNKDLPTKEIEDFVANDKSGSIILHGTPGCGKSSYIKYLLKKHGGDGRDGSTLFILLSQNVLSQYLEQFKSILMAETRRVVYVVEDCEELLKPREHGNRNSYLLADLLNFMDGIAAETCKAKFIFTFNTKLTEIDSAILRKGRCRVRYEFKPLVGEYLKSLAESLGYALTEEQEKNGVAIADIFNKTDRDSNSIVNTRKKIGFA